MKVLFATAEFAPVASVGGLAAAAAGLVQELRRRGTAIDVVMPMGNLAREFFESISDFGLVRRSPDQRAQCP